MSIQLLKTKIKANQVYKANQVLLPLIAICESIGFTEVADLDVMTYKQGTTVTFWKDDESIQFENNIENPSIYMDCDCNVEAFVRGKMKNTMSKFNGRVGGATIDFNLRGA